MRLGVFEYGGKYLGEWVLFFVQSKYSMDPSNGGIEFRRNPSNGGVLPRDGIIVSSVAGYPGPGIIPPQPQSGGIPVPNSSPMQIVPGGPNPLVNSRGKAQEIQAEKSSMNYTTFVKGYGGILLLLMVAVVAIVTISFTISLSNQNSDVSSEMVVLTGHRTRDWSSMNSYSMYSSDEDQYTRLYVCMKASGISVPGDPAIQSIGDFRAAARNHYDCGAASDGGWPRDYGFLRCVQRHFYADFHQSNVFLKCLDLSEGYMVETIQTPASFIFLGSYNFVAMLLACMGVITAFLMFTAGGYYTLKELHDFHGHAGATVIWSPLAWGPTLLALGWSVFMFFATMIYAYPPSNMWSDAVDGTAGALPGTPWTGFICSGISIAMVVYFASCLAELFSDMREVSSGNVGTADTQKKLDPLMTDDIESSQQQNQSLLPTPSGNIIVPSSNGFNTPQFQYESHRELPPIPGYNPNLTPGSGFQSSSSSTSSFSGVPSQSSGFGRRSDSGSVTAGQPVAEFWASQFSNRKGNAYSRIPTQLGIRYNNQLHYSGSGAMRIAPLMNKAFALTWVFADGLLFIGMLNSQNSLLNEDVVTIWYYIVLCRGFQLAATYFMDDVLFIELEAKTGQLTESEKLLSVDYLKNNEIKAHAGIAVACSHLSSLWCMIIVLYRFGEATSVSTNLNSSGVSNPIHGLQIAFMFIIASMDVFKHIIAFLSIFGYFTQQIYFLIIEATFNADWFIRSVFIIATIFTVPQYLGDLNYNLYNYIIVNNA